MTSIGLICAGVNSEAFTLKLCQTCHDFQAQNKIVFVGVHPSSDNATSTVTKLQNLKIRAATVERQNTDTTDIYALATLFQAFNDITVRVPDLIVLVLDEEFITEPDLITQSWQTIRTFSENYYETHKTEVIAVYFTPEDRYTNALDQIKTLSAMDRKSAVSKPLAHMLMISERASLWEKFGNGYRDMLARQLAILLISEAPSTVTVPFRQQIRRIATPFVGMALDEFETARTSIWPVVGQGQLPQQVVKDISRSLVEAVVNLLNMAKPQASFDTISPEARRNGRAMLAINIFIPPLRDKDRTALDSAVGSALSDCGIDAQGRVVMAQRQQHIGAQPLKVISCSLLELVKENAFLKRVPVINRLPVLQNREKRCQILILFGIEDSYLP